MDEATLAKLEKDLAGEGGGVLRAYFRGSPRCVRAWEIAAKHSDDIRKSTDFLNYLSDYLDEFPYLGEDLADGVVFSAYKDFYPDIRQSFEVLDDVADDVIDEVIEKTKNSKSKEFWKWIHLGRKFEKEFLLPRLKNRFSYEYTQLKNKASEIFKVNLDQYDMYSQVQLKFGDEDKYFVADQVYVKWGKADDGVTDEIKDIIIIEDKLSEGTKLTARQNQGKAASELTVRSKTLDPDSNVSGNALPKDAVFKTNNKWLKVFDTDKGESIKDIIKL